jgi:UrcA family protein
MNTNLKTRCFSSLLIGLVATFSVGAAIAGVGSEDAVRSIGVSFADLNLTTDQGIAALYGRLQAAASSVCGPQPSAREIMQSTDWANCRRGAIDRAIAKVDHPALTALYHQKTGRMSPILVASTGPRAR